MLKHCSSNSRNFKENLRRNLCTATSSIFMIVCSLFKRVTCRHGSIVILESSLKSSMISICRITWSFDSGENKLNSKFGIIFISWSAKFHQYQNMEFYEFHAVILINPFSRLEFFATFSAYQRIMEKWNFAASFAPNYDFN